MPVVGVFTDSPSSTTVPEPREPEEGMTTAESTVTYHIIFLDAEKPSHITFEQVQEVIASGTFDSYLLLFSSSALSSVVARQLEDAHCCFCGPASHQSSWTARCLKMQAFYSDVPMAPFRFLAASSSADERLRAAEGLEYPLRIVVRAPGASAAAAGSDVIVASAAELEASLAASMKKAPLVLLEEAPTLERAVSVAVVVAPGFAADGTTATEHLLPLAFQVVGSTTTNTDRGLVAAFHSKKIEQLSRKLYRQLHDACDASSQRHGIVGFIFRAEAKEDGKVLLTDIAVNCPLLQRGTLWADALESMDIIGEISARMWLDEAVLFSQKMWKLPAFVVDFDPRQKGYFVRASRDIEAGEIIFFDEGHAFPIITKPHVDAHWSSEKRDVFSRYAWPVSSDGHVYAIWENDPMKWRPINHSCDPNMEFGERHSLNVVARRRIAKGQDLTMDYSIFCDGVMKPFDCFCGAANCRRTVLVDEKVLRAYGDRAWHRGVPGGPLTLRESSS